ncbi:hypothetical protein AYI68_g3436 [Smittium mucronatum]|uniref:Uncharacterized protein n=1 Tax=Smittium mucronatum TaxID=133383 RepID=A0A1R0GZX0_9FUNG|nr:hypothetical protein AYI68_g3436 [Smittium mucronatum]
MNSIIDYIKTISLLELGYLNIEDDTFSMANDLFFVKSFLFFPLSRAVFLSRLKKKSIPKYMKYALLCCCAKLIPRPKFFKGGMNLVGSRYADEAFKLLKSNLSDITIDKIFSSVILSVHYANFSKLNHSLYLIGK